MARRARDAACHAQRRRSRSPEERALRLRDIQFGDVEAEAAPLPEIPEAPRRRWPIRPIFYGLVSLFLILLVWLALTAPLSKSLQPVAAPGITLLSAEGDPIARRGADIRAPVSIARLPDHVPEAFVAIEDKRFREHIGISVRGIARATWRNLGAGGVREGGSTITQQLAKVSFLNADRTFGRKAREALIAFWLEAWLSKNEILERYLSNVYFGDNTYGLRAASHHYFSKPPERLNPAEAAMLAGMVKAPSRLAPTRNYQAARARGRIVIAEMIDQGFLTRAEANLLKPARLRVEPRRAMPTGTWFADWVIGAARARGDENYGEQQIATTLETRMQRLAEDAVRRARLGGAQVALVAMRPDGRVVAMVGGTDYAKSPFNRAVQARRQSGSAFKLFVYLAALRAGIDPGDMVDDNPLTLGAWNPANFGGRYRGRISVADAFAYSSNVAAVRLQERVGRERVIRAARNLGLTTPLADMPSLALGTSQTRLIEMTAAYAAVAHGEWPVRPRGLEEPAMPWWRSLWDKATATRSDGNFDEMREMMAGVVERGTGRGAAISIPAYGKTGTSQGNRDAVFIGFAGDLVTGVWIGHDDERPLAGVGGGGTPARIWRDFMSRALGAEPRAPAALAPAPLAPERELENEIVNALEPLLKDQLNGSVSIPIEGTGLKVGIEMGEDGVRISTDRDEDPGPAREPAEPAAGARQEEGAEN